MVAVPLFFVLSAVYANLVQGIVGLMCFECNSLYDSNCENLGREPQWGVLYQHCSPFAPNENVTEFRKPLCRKIIQKIRTRGNLKLTKRSCGYVLHKNSEENVCYEVRNEDHEEIVCQCFEDGCNSAWSVLRNFSLIDASFYLILLPFSSFVLNLR